VRIIVVEFIVLTKILFCPQSYFNLHFKCIRFFIFFSLKRYSGEKINILNDCAVSDIMCLYIVLNLHGKGFRILKYHLRLVAWTFLTYFQREKKIYSIRGAQSQNGCIMYLCIYTHTCIHHDNFMFTLDVT